MAVVGAKGTFAGPGGTTNDNGNRRRGLVCDEVRLSFIPSGYELAAKV